jgi:hypothetical protein
MGFASTRSVLPGGFCFTGSFIGYFSEDSGGPSMRRSGPSRWKVEVMSGFEPLNNAFAERSLTTWVHHRRAEVKKKRRNFNQWRSHDGVIDFT